MFKNIKLWFKDREHYYQRKRYSKLQREYRAKLMRQVKEFCPWSGWYINEMVKTMLEFFEKTYTAKDCCWTTDEHLDNVAVQVRQALDYVTKLDMIDNVDSCADLIPYAEEYHDEFVAYCKEVEEKFDLADQTTTALGYAAYEFLERKYTSELYNTIGKNLWGWYD